MEIPSIIRKWTTDKSVVHFYFDLKNQQQLYIYLGAQRHILKTHAYWAAAHISKAVNYLYFFINKYIKYGAPIKATTTPAGIPFGSTRLRPIVSAKSKSQPPIRIEIGMNN